MNSHFYYGAVATGALKVLGFYLTAYDSWIARKEVGFRSAALKMRALGLVEHDRFLNRRD